jgi:hypothetical protein
MLFWFKNQLTLNNSIYQKGAIIEILGLDFTRSADYIAISIITKILSRKIICRC